MIDSSLFFTTFIEILSIMVLWNNLGLQSKHKYLKILIIAVTTSFLVVIGNRINSPYINLINIIFFNMIIKVIFKKSLQELLVEFSVIATISILLELLNTFATSLSSYF